MQQFFNYLTSKETIITAVIAFSLAFFFMRFIPNHRQRKILRVFFLLTLIIGPLMIGLQIGEDTKTAASLVTISTVVLVALKDTNLERAENRLKKKQKANEKL